MESFDVVIVGGGPAGLSAALILGRCRRRVLVCDGGKPRNAASHGLHGYLTRDGIEPADFLTIARDQLAQYDGVQLRSIEVVDAQRAEQGFVCTLADQTKIASRKLLLATGVVDELPELKDLQSFYGRSVFHCPYCDGWEMRDRALAVYGRGENGLGLALELTLWSKDIVLCTDGPSGLSTAELLRLQHNKIELREEKIEQLVGASGQLQKILFVNGDSLARDGLFFSTGQHQHSDLAVRLGCKFSEQGCIDTGDYEVTSIPGLYAAGDVSRLMQLVIVAAAEGAQAAFAMNKEMLKEDLL